VNNGVASLDNVAINLAVNEAARATLTATLWTQGFVSSCARVNWAMERPILSSMRGHCVVRGIGTCMKTPALDAPYTVHLE